MAAPKFDKSRPHGVIFPPAFGATLYQDGWHFLENGEVCRALCTPEQLAVLDGGVPPPAANGDKPKVPRPRKTLAPSVQDDGSDVDFVAWLEGRQECADAHVLAKARDLYGSELETIGQVKEHLVFVEQLVPEDRVRV